MKMLSAKWRKISLGRDVLILIPGTEQPIHYAELTRGLRPANERRRYFVTTSLIGWAQTKNQPCYAHVCWLCYILVISMAQWKQDCVIRVLIYRHVSSTYVPTLINNYIYYKVMDNITYPFPNFNGCTERISDFIPHFAGYANIFHAGLWYMY